MTAFNGGGGWAADEEYPTPSCSILILKIGEEPKRIAKSGANMDRYNTGTEELLCKLEDGVAIITLNRPHARNSLSDQLTPALRHTLKAAGEDQSVRAVLLTGAGEAFCSGGNVKEMDASAPSESDPEAKIALLVERQRTLTGLLVNLSKPTIAALPGAAAGAGLSLALACDFRIAAEAAFVTTGYAKIGLSGDYGICWLLDRLVGPSKAKELMFFSERISASRCQAIGLVNWVVPRDELQARALEKAKVLADGPTSAFAGMKDNLRHASAADFLTALDHEARNMVESAATMEHKEAVRAFVEKRSPKFR